MEISLSWIWDLNAAWIANINLLLHQLNSPDTCLFFPSALITHFTLRAPSHLAGLSAETRAGKVSAVIPPYVHITSPSMPPTRCSARGRWKRRIQQLQLNNFGAINVPCACRHRRSPANWLPALLICLYQTSPGLFRLSSCAALTFCLCLFGSLPGCWVLVFWE